MDLAVIIPHYNDTVRLTRCLEALMAQDQTGVEVIVADNNSTDPMDEIRDRFRDVRFVTEMQKGAAAARNRGVAESTAPMIAFLDADCVPSETWLAVAKTSVRDGMLFGGRITVFDETPAPRSGAEAYETVFAFDQESYIRDKGFSVTANLLTTRADFEATGPMIVGVSEDFEWCQRAVAKGLTLDYLPELVVSHPTRHDWPTLEKKWRRMVDEGFERYRDRRLAYGIYALGMIASLGLHIPKMLLSQKLSLIERVRGVATLCQLRVVRMVWMLRQLMGQKIV